MLEVRMIGSSVLMPPDSNSHSVLPTSSHDLGTSPGMDPLSEVLALMKPQSLSCGGFVVPGDLAVCFPKHHGVKCYAMLVGECWLAVDGVDEPVLLRAGDCFLLPRGLPFRLTTDLSLEPVHYTLA